MSAKILVSTENMPYADWLEYRKQGIRGLRHQPLQIPCGAVVG